VVMAKQKSASVNLVRFKSDDEAREYLERLRWPEGPVCPHCKGVKAYKLTPRLDSKKPARAGLWKCAACRKQFSVTVGTIFEDSHIPVGKWLSAIYLLCASKKGMSAHQLHRMLGVTYKSAWFMAHRIRYAMEQKPLRAKLRGIVEADETYIGRRPRGEAPWGGRPARDSHMRPVVALVERGGRVRSFHVGRVTSENLAQVIRDNVEGEARLMTDQFKAYTLVGREFASHETVNHGMREYVRGDVTTNTVEGFFGLLKRGLNGVYHQVGSHHLHRYLAEFDFRYNLRRITDGERAEAAIRGFEGKRLTYRDSSATRATASK
jgi:transposase-like protein